MFVFLLVQKIEDKQYATKEKKHQAKRDKEEDQLSSKRGLKYSLS